MNSLTLTLDPEVLARVEERLRRHREERAKCVAFQIRQLDGAQRFALQWFRDGGLPGQQPNATLRRIFDLVRFGLVEKIDGRYHLTSLGSAVQRAVS